MILNRVQLFPLKMVIVPKLACLLRTSKHDSFEPLASSIATWIRACPSSSPTRTPSDMKKEKAPGVSELQFLNCSKCLNCLSQYYEKK